MSTHHTRAAEVLRLILFAAGAMIPSVVAAQSDLPGRLTLGDAARMAATRSAAAVTSRERALQTGARAVQFRSDLLPTVTTSSSIDGGDARLGPAGSPTAPSVFGRRTVNVRLEATQRLFDWSAIKRWQASAADAAAAGATARLSAETAAEEGAIAYLRVLKAQGRLEARQADSSLAADLLVIARQLLTAGTAIGLDVTRAESQMASTLSDLITARNDRNRAELEMLRVLALPVDTRLALADSLRPPLPTDREVDEPTAVKEAMARRGDVLAAEATAAAARRQVTAVRAERLPAVSLYGTTGSSVDGIMNQQTYGIQVSMPLFDGFRREARIAEGRSREREADAQWQDARLRAHVGVRSALLDMGATRERVAATGVQLRLAELELAQARSRFQAGVASNADLINASLALNRARDQVVDALTAYHAARVGLASARGRTTELP